MAMLNNQMVVHDTWDSVQQNLIMKTWKKVIFG